MTDTFHVNTSVLSMLQAARFFPRRIWFLGLPHFPWGDTSVPSHRSICVSPPVCRAEDGAVAHANFQRLVHQPL